MSVCFRTLAVLSFSLVVGCATKEEQPTAARAETGVQKHHTIGASEVQKARGSGLLRYTDHINPASEEVQRELQQ
ncbi:MAG TPA: hypothetical protein VIS96_17280 [Terrimicrobiaceae bacterium]